MKLCHRPPRAFTLIELMIVVAIVGVLAMLGAYGVRRYMANAKTLEARQQIGAISKAVVLSFEAEKQSGGTLAAGQSSTALRRLCSSSTQVPSTAAHIKGTKYQPVITDWDGDSTTGWVCLRFAATQPTFFMYQYTANTDSGSFGITANGDLNGDGALSTLWISGQVVADQVTISPSIAEIDPDE